MTQDDKSQGPAWLRGIDADAVSIWELPEVGGEHTVALERKKPDPVLEEAISVIEEEVVAERVTLAELERIHEDARQEGMKLGREEGHAQGFSEGREKGLQDGLAQGQAQIQAAVETLRSMAEKLHAPLEEQAAELERELVKMVVELSRAVVRHELASRPEILLESVQLALSELPKNAGNPVLQVHPQDADTLAPLLEANPEWQIQPDDQLTPGGCRVQTAYSLVDANVEMRFEQAAEKLLEQLARNQAADAHPDETSEDASGQNPAPGE